MKKKSKFKYGLAAANSPNEAEALANAFNTIDGERVDGPDWDMLWYFNHEPPAALYKNIAGARRVNHIPGIHAITDKWQLYENLTRHWQNLKSEDKPETIHRFFPATWKLPDHQHEIRQQMLNHPDKPYILKLMNMVSGAGMKLIAGANELPENGSWLVQEYINTPHLINKRKYILQVFLLITSSLPLTAYVYTDGVADLAVQPYSTDPAEWKNTGMHIATTTLQSQQPGFDLEKHCLTFKQWREHTGDIAETDRVWKEIETLLKNTLHAIKNTLATNAKKLLNHPEQCFELLAIDIMLDDQLKPWVIECNRSASMIPDYTGKLKPALLKDTLGLILNRREELINTPDGQSPPAPAAKFGKFKRLL